MFIEHFVSLHWEGGGRRHISQNSPQRPTQMVIMRSDPVIMLWLTLMARNDKQITAHYWILARQINWALTWPWHDSGSQPQSQSHGSVIWDEMRCTISPMYKLLFQYFKILLDFHNHNPVSSLSWSQCLLVPRFSQHDNCCIMSSQSPVSGPALWWAVR